jgi:hypothetical protein
MDKACSSLAFYWGKNIFEDRKSPGIRAEARRFVSLNPYYFSLDDEPERVQQQLERHNPQE